jgi:hypothetical protein
MSLFLLYFPPNFLVNIFTLLFIPHPPLPTITMAISKRLNMQRADLTRLLLGLAGADLIIQWIGLMEYIACYSTQGSTTCH